MQSLSIAGDSGKDNRSGKTQLLRAPTPVLYVRVARTDDALLEKVAQGAFRTRQFLPNHRSRHYRFFRICQSRDLRF
jgi:hypothetical protein